MLMSTYIGFKMISMGQPRYWRRLHRFSFKYVRSIINHSRWNDGKNIAMFQSTYVDKWRLIYSASQVCKNEIYVWAFKREREMIFLTLFVRYSPVICFTLSMSNKICCLINFFSFLFLCLRFYKTLYTILSPCSFSRFFIIELHSNIVFG